MTRQSSRSELDPTALSRREFLRDSGAVAAALAGTAQLTSTRRASAARSPTAPVMLGLIGCGRRGMQLLQAALAKPGVIFSTVCDVDTTRGTAAVELAAKLAQNRPALSVDYRDVIDDHDIEGVIIATPDHWHMIPFLDACAAGKDVYVEVPLAPTVSEVGTMAYATRKYKRVVQVGLQQRSARPFTEAGGIARSGTLGRIAQTRTWSFARRSPIAAEPDAKPVASLDYDRWLGPAPQRPYNPGRVRDPEHFWDYGGGEAALWNVHLQDLVNTAMRVTVPRSVVAVGGNYGLDDARETPDTLDVIFEYAVPSAKFTHIYSLRLNNAYAGWGPAALPPLVGPISPPAGPNPPPAGPASPSVGPASSRSSNDSDAAPFDLPGRSGVQFFGSEKTLYVSGKRLLLLPAGAESPIEDLRYLGIGSSHETVSRPAANGALSVDPLTVAHVQEFVECIRSRKEPSATIESAEVAMFPCLAANIAYRVGRKLYIEPEKREFYADPGFKQRDDEANKLAIRHYRPPYVGPKG